MTQAERDEREEFVCEASRLMYARFMAQEVWEHMGFDTKECLAYVEQAEMMKFFRQALFSRIVPTVKDIGLWGPKVQALYEEMGVINFQDLVPDELSAADEQIAQELDARRAQVQETIAAGAEA